MYLPSSSLLLSLLSELDSEIDSELDSEIDSELDLESDYMDTILLICRPDAQKSPNKIKVYFIINLTKRFGFKDT